MSPQTRHAHARRRLRGRSRVPTLDGPSAERALAIYRAQRRHAIAPLGLLFGGLFGLPLLFEAFPELDSTRLYSIPLSWLALVLVPYPALVVLSRWQLRRAEQVEEAGGPWPDPPGRDRPRDEQ